MINYSYNKVVKKVPIYPYYKQNCSDCKYLFTLYLQQEKETKIVEIYKACDKSVSDYIVVIGKNEEDYITCNLEHLLAGYLMKNIYRNLERREGRV